VKRLLVTWILIALLLTACGGLIRAGQTPIPGPTGSPSPAETAIPGGAGEEGSDGAPGDDVDGTPGEGQGELPVTDGPPLTG
jgi:hypothetical protein